MSAHLTDLEAQIFALGVFIIFVVTFADYVLKKIGPIISDWLGRGR